MAKRFTDTDKWKKKWFRELGSKLRDVRQFILDDCDFAGIWDIDLSRVSYHTGESVTLNDIKQAFNDEIQILSDGNSLHVLGFIPFQYGILKQTNNVHKSVLKRLESKVHNPTPGQPLPYPCPAPKDKEEEKDKDKEKEKEEADLAKKRVAEIISQVRTLP